MKLKPSEGKLELNSSLFHFPSSPGVSTKKSVLFLSQRFLAPWGGRGRPLQSAGSEPATTGPAHRLPHLVAQQPRGIILIIFILMNEIRAKRL